MPIDSRRLPVPEESQTPYGMQKDVPLPRKLIDKKGCRCDGRRPDQIRPIFLKAGVVSQAKGSAYIEMNQTKVICAVYGPREVTRREDFSMQGQLNCEFKFATFSCRLRRQHQQDSEEKDMSAVLLQALEPTVQLEKFPKARMDVFVTVLEDDGGALAAAINCASVALADAGIEMYDLVVGASIRQFGTLTLIDPSAEEEFKSKRAEDAENNGSITVGLMPSLHQVAALVQKGELTVQTAVEGIKLCTEACQKTYPVLQRCLTKSVKERLQNTKT